MRNTENTITKGYLRIYVLLRFLNVCGGIISGIWLVVLHSWYPTVPFGLVLLVVWLALTDIALWALLFVFAAEFFAKRNSRFLSVFFTLLSHLYIAAMITAWCLLVFRTFMHSVDNNSLIPLLFWSYGVALWPLVLSDIRDRKRHTNTSSVILMVFAAVSCVITMIMFYFGSDFKRIIFTFSWVMLLCAFLQTSISSAVDKQWEDG